MCLLSDTDRADSFPDSSPVRQIIRHADRGAAGFQGIEDQGTGGLEQMRVLRMLAKDPARRIRRRGMLPRHCKVSLSTAGNRSRRCLQTPRCRVTCTGLRVTVALTVCPSGIAPALQSPAVGVRTPGASCCSRSLGAGGHTSSPTRTWAGNSTCPRESCACSAWCCWEGSADRAEAATPQPA